jgi:hypothetical protein
MMKKPARIIAVLGMHRSGTSAMARALGYIGASLGNDFIENMPEVNAKGFWEDATLNRVNIELLRLLGCDWLSNRRIPSASWDTPEVALLVDHAVAILIEKLKGVEIFAFKDPRTAILLPFWQRAFAKVGVDVSYLLALRHPVSVAESLQRRDGIDPAKADFLWLHYTIPSIQQTEGSRRVLVDYDLLMDQPVHELTRIAQALDLTTPTVAAQTEFAGKFLSQELRHSHQKEAEFRPSSPDSSITIPLYTALRRVANGKFNLESETIRTAISVAENQLAAMTPFLAYADQLEFAVAASAIPPDSRFPWLQVLRASFVTSHGLNLSEAPPAVAQIDPVQQKCSAETKGQPMSNTWRSRVKGRLATYLPSLFDK